MSYKESKEDLKIFGNDLRSGSYKTIAIILISMILVILGISNQVELSGWGRRRLNRAYP